MRVTVVQLNANKLESEWEKLRKHVSANGTDFLLLPEMPFYKWICAYKDKDQKEWIKSIEEHNLWLQKLNDLGTPLIAGSKPVIENEENYNVGWMWSEDKGIEDIHTKYYLPNEPGFWEANWYNRGQKEFNIFRKNDLNFGMMICTDMWFMQHAQKYGEELAQMIIVPRSTPTSTVSKWLTGGKTIGVISGAYSLSSNHSGLAPDGTTLGGTGWISDHEGELLGQTTNENPFVTMELDLKTADKAKSMYPRYVKR